MFLRWKWDNRLKEWNCRKWFGFGRSCATVWNNGTWHTWDKDGVGGENASEKTVFLAMKKAKSSAIFQGFV